jgi:hypothetical protein
MFTLWNPTGAPQDIVATFYYGDGSGKYALPVHLDPQASTTIDMAMLIAELKPDANGNIIPPSVREGSASFASAKGENTSMTLVIAGGIYNVSTATCGNTCVTCCGNSNFGVSVPAYCPIGETMACTSSAVNCWGTTVQPSWSSSNTSIVTIGDSGSMTGHSLGSANIVADFSQGIVYTGQICTQGTTPPCPTGGPVYTNSTTVTPTVTIDSFSPNPILTGNNASAHITVNPSATIDLAISKGGNGTATFGTGSNTTLQITQTTTVNIAGGTPSSNGSADLTLSASYQGSVLATQQFGVTTGTCTAAYSGHGGDGPKNCPVQNLTFYDTYNLQNFCKACSYSCIPISYDSTFTPATPAGCLPSTVNTVGSSNATLTLTQKGNFTATDCSYHNLQIKTTVTNAQGVPTDYIGGTFGLKCNKYPNGSPCP